MGMARKPPGETQTPGAERLPANSNLQQTYDQAVIRRLRLDDEVRPRPWLLAMAEKTTIIKIESAVEDGQQYKLGAQLDRTLEIFF